MRTTPAAVVLVGLLARSVPAACPPEVGSAVTTIVHEPQAGAGFDSYAYGMAVVPGGGGVVVVGEQATTTGGQDWLVVRYDAALNTELASTGFNGSGVLSDEANAVAVAPGGSIYVAGGAVVSGSKDGVIRLYNANLTQLVASTPFDGATAGSDVFQAVTLDAEGNVLAGGYEDFGGDLRWIVRKYSPDLSTLLGTTTYNGPMGSGNDQVRGIAVDAGGTIYVTGWQLTTGGDFDWVTRKYSPDLAVLLASTTWNGSNNGHDEALAVLCLAGGDVVVGGYDIATGGLYDWLIRRYDSSLSTVVRDIRFDGPGSDQDTLGGMALDEAGRILACGNVQMTKGGDTGWGVGVFDPVAGTTLGHVENGLDPAQDETPYAVASAAGGVIYVAGSDSWGVSNNGRWRVSRYACTASVPPVADTPPVFAEPVGFPNPYRPGQGLMTLAGLPADAEVAIYSGRGVLVRRLTADAGGRAHWDGLTTGGGTAGSGVYMAVATGAGRTVKIRFVVQR